MSLSPTLSGWIGDDCIPVQHPHGYALNVTLATGAAGAAAERAADCLIAADNLREVVGLHCLLADRPLAAQRAGRLTPFGRACLSLPVTAAECAA